KLMITALRSFFRYLYLRGDIATNLAAAVPKVPKWRFTTVPKWIPGEQVTRLLQSCDQTTGIGRRDYAILILLSRFGLRAGEIVSMTLDDLNWEAGEIVVRGKGNRRERLPIPHDVGKALVKYLRKGRPQCVTRRVFIRDRAPHQGFRSSGVIGYVVRRALTRVGLDPPFKGAHLLRHSLATEMLRRGGALNEICELLRHRHPNTTQIYAKVDLVALNKLAAPWPEVA
ncbi:MAG: site-specific integrase, partial [Planctomycetota bacterium]